MQGIKVFLELVVTCVALIAGGSVCQDILRKATYRACGDNSPDPTTAVRWWGWPAGVAAGLSVCVGILLAGLFVLSL